MEIERFGREEKELEGEREMGLLLPWLLGECSRNLAEDSSCESDLREGFSEIGERPGQLTAQ